MHKLFYFNLYIHICTSKLHVTVMVAQYCICNVFYQRIHLGNSIYFCLYLIRIGAVLTQS